MSHGTDRVCGRAHVHGYGLVYRHAAGTYRSPPESAEAVLLSTGLI